MSYITIKDKIAQMKKQDDAVSENPVSKTELFKQKVETLELAKSEAKIALCAVFAEICIEHQLEGAGVTRTGGTYYETNYEKGYEYYEEDTHPNDPIVKQIVELRDIYLNSLKELNIDIFAVNGIHFKLEEKGDNA